MKKKKAPKFTLPALVDRRRAPRPAKEAPSQKAKARKKRG
jgi:hypothetical protein